MIDVLTGKSNERICRNGHDQLSTFGIGADMNAAQWRGLFRQLVAAGLLLPDDEGHGTLQLSQTARPLLRGEAKFQMRRVISQPRSRKTRRKSSASKITKLSHADAPLYDALKALRMRLANKAKVPPYVICHDKTLIELAQKRPKTEAALHDITGLGEAKIKRYGADLLRVLAEFKRDPLLDNRLSSTINETLALHLAGQSAEAIAAHRNLDVSTIYGHFAEAIEAGLIDAAQVIELADDETDAILAAFEDCDTLDSGKLGPVHAALDGRFNYGVLKCLLAELA